MENRITNGSISKALLSYFFPIMMGSIFQQLYNTRDTVIVGNFVGADALRAVGGTGTFIRLLVGFFLGLSSGATVIISQFYGAAKKDELHKAVHTAAALAVAGGAILTVGGIRLTNTALKLINIPDDIMDLSALYLRIYFLGMIPSMIYNIGSGVLRAIGDSKRPRNYLIFTCLMNIVLDIVFVVVFSLGVAGVALATVLAQTASAALVMRALMRTTDIYKLTLSKVRFYGDTLASILRIGLPAGGQSVLYAMSNLIMQRAVNGYGTLAIASWTAFFKIDDIIWLVLGAFGTSVITFVGQNYGAGRNDRVKESVKTGLLMSAVTIIAMSACLYVCARPLIMLFTQEGEVITVGTQILHLCAPFYVTFIFNEVLSGAIKGSGEGFMPMLITIFTICLFRFFWVIVIAPHLPRTILSIRACYPVTWALSSAVFIVYYLYYRKRFA